MNRYDPETHTYWINEVQVPGHTDLLPKPTFMVDPETLEAARQEGEDNHSLIKMFFDTDDTFGHPMLIALNTFLFKHRKKFGKQICYEKPLYSKQLMFAGTLDAVFKNAIIDWKRQPGNSRIHALQLALQFILADHAGLALNWDWRTLKGYIAWYDGEQFKMRDVMKNNPDAIETAKALICRYWDNHKIEEYLKPKDKND